MLNKLTQKIKSDLNINIENMLEVKPKNTARAARKYLCKVEEETFLLCIAETKDAIFYLERSIQNQKKFEKQNSRFSLNNVIYKIIFEKKSIALYKYFEDFEESDDETPIEYLLDFYECYGKEVYITNDVINDIKNDFLMAWPERIRFAIQRMDLFKQYLHQISKFKKMKLIFEHGDFTQNNILVIKSKRYLMDFEFSKQYQPIGFDLYDYRCSIKKKMEVNLPYLELNQIKLRLVNEINKMLDNHMKDVKVYDTFDEELLIKWKEAYEIDNYPYNMSPDWNRIWFKYFGNKRILHIVTLWEKEELVLLAPFYLDKGILYLVGSNPDLYDTFDIIVKKNKKKNLEILLEFINQYEINFRFMNTENEISKFLIEYFYPNKYVAEIIDNKPSLINLHDFDFTKKIKQDIKRCKNRALNMYKDNIKFEFSIEKNSKLIDEFIQMHKKRWMGGPFQHMKNFECFIKEIIMTTNLVVISRIRLENNNISLAYHLFYRTNSILYSSIPTYNIDFEKISPGKILLYDFIKYCRENKQYRVLDFGRGAESYKYWFSNKDELLFSFVNKKESYTKKIKRIMYRIMRRLNV